jgi:hypothetical protein
VTQEAKKPGEFRRYRQVLTAAYLSLAAAITILLTASIVKELFFRRSQVTTGTALPTERPDPGALLECHQMVLDLLTTLGATTGELLALPPQGDRGELASRWEDFSRAWRDEWDVAEARCRFSELAETEMGVAFDRLAKVHGDLPSMRLKYQSLLVRFDEEQAAELAGMRRALDLSRRDLVDQVRRMEPTPSGR